MIKESQKGEITAEYWTKVFVSTVVAVTVVANINMVMDALYKTGGAFIDGMITVVDDNTSLESQQVTMDENKKKALLHGLTIFWCTMASKVRSGALETISTPKADTHQQVRKDTGAALAKADAQLLIRMQVLSNEGSGWAL